MKSTQERLNKSYCRPTTEEEWAKFTVSRFTSLGYASTYVYFYNDPDLDMVQRIKSDTWIPSGLTEIPVSHFIDLLNDSIVPWRLEEDGFDIQDGITYFETVAGSFRIEANGEVSHIVTGRTANVDTYTDLLTLIRLIA